MTENFPAIVRNELKLFILPFVHDSSCTVRRFFFLYHDVTKLCNTFPRLGWRVEFCLFGEGSGGRGGGRGRGVV